jgi:cytochrome c oxidase subunit 2
MIVTFLQKLRSLRIPVGLVAVAFIGAGNLKAQDHAPQTVITIHAKQFEFVPSEITIHIGQPVKLVFVSDDVPHAITVEGLAIDLPIKREPSSVVITPEKIAELTGRCSRYCGSGHRDMLLTVHVVK